MGYVNIIAIDENVLNQLNFVSWLIDLELITCKVTYQGRIYKDVIVIFICGWISINEEDDWKGWYFA